MSGPIVMILRGFVDQRGQQQSTAFDGQYLRDFDFEANDGRGEIDMTPDLAEAKRFPTLADAVAFRNRVPECKPLREDGKPNRPLTATHWQLHSLGDDQ